MGAGQSATDMAERKRAQARTLVAEADNWEQGAAGERHVGAILDRLPDEYVVFHDLRIPGSKANVDHLVIGPGGVFVIDTKKSLYPVTLGRGRGADKIWTGGHPLKLKPCLWEASKVESRIGVPVKPVVCILAPSLPEPLFDFDGVRVCHPNRVVGEVTSGKSVALEVGRISERVAREFNAEPQVRNPEGSRQRAPHGTRQQKSKEPLSNGSRKQGALSVIGSGIGLFEKPWFKLLLIGAVTIAAMNLLPLLTADVARTVTDRMVRDLVPTTIPDDPPTTTLSAAPATSPMDAPPSVLIETSCPNPGMGWTASFGWPGDLPAGAVAYSVRWQLDGGSIIRHDIGGWTDPAESLVEMLIPNGSEQLFITDYLGDDGQILASTQQRFEAPGSC